MLAQISLPAEMQALPTTAILNRFALNDESVCACVCVCVCVCVHVYVVYEDTNLYNDMGMT